MKSVLSVIFTLLLFSLITGCSKKKEEQPPVEQEVTEPQADTIATDTLAMQDTLAESGAEMEETTAPSSPEMMPPHPISGYTVQVAGCESSEYADYLIELYKKRGYDPYLTTATVNDQTYYRVRIGDFDNLQDAKALQNELRDKYSVQAWIDKP